jgi:hypothetical protein
VGNNYPRYWDYIPASNNVGSAALTVNVLNNQGTVVSTAASTITTVAVSSNSPSSNIVVACLGDSLTDAGIWPAEFYRRLTQPGGIPLGLGFSNIQFAGDRPLSGYPSNSFTGWGGWRWLDYTNTATTSAAWLTVTANDKTAADLGGYWQDGNGNQWRLMATNGNTLKVGNISSSISTLGSSGTLTYVSSATHQTSIAYTAVLPAILSPLNNTNSMTFTNIGNFSGFTNVSILYVLLGWNGLAGADLPYATNHTAFQGQAQAVINQLHADYPNAQVRIMGMEVPSPSGGLGANYGATGADANFYELLRTLNGVRLAYQQLCDFPSNSAFCRYVDIAGQFDSDNNMSVIPVVVNSRNSAAEWRGSNGVHPATQGYYQIADAVWRDFVYTYCQGSNYAYSAGSLTPYFNLPIAVSGSLTLTTNNGVPTIGSSAGGGNVLSAGQNNFSGSNWFSGLTTFGLSPVGNGANFTNIGYSSLNLAALNTTGAAAILGYQLGQLGPLGDISFNPGNGNMSVGGTMTATSFTGNAAALTNMSGATIQSGTIPAAALTANSIGSNQLSATITAQLGGGGSVTLSGNNQWSGNQQFNTLTYFTAGASSSGSGLYSEAWGGSAVANGTSGTALGNNANDVSAGGVALGAYATANNVAAIAIGSNATANLNAIAIGQNTTAANNTVVIGGAGTTIFSTPGVITGSGAGLTNLPNLGLSVNFTNVVSGSTIWLSASNGSAQVYAWTNSTEILCPALDNYTKLATFRLTIYSTNAAPTINVAASNCFNGSLMALTATTNIASAFLLDRDSDFNSTNKFTLFRLK